MKHIQRAILVWIAFFTTTSILVVQPTIARPARTVGATLPYAEVQAENSTTNGTIIGPDRHYPGLATEAIERRAVTLKAQGQYVEFTVPQKANSIVLRYSIPDSADGSGQTVPLSLYINGTRQPDLMLTSKYSWFYGNYPFSNKPWDVRPHHYYDEIHWLTDQMAAGSKVKVQLDADDTAAAYTIDLMDFEQVDPAAAQPADYLSLTDFGADATGAKDSTDALQKAVNVASSQNKGLWIPQGTFTINSQIAISNVTIRGAGMWYSTLHFVNPSGNNEGLYGNYAPTPSQNVHLSDFAILGEVTNRIDSDQTNGIGGSLANSTIQNLWIEHTKVGIWLDGPFDHVTITSVRIRDVFADGINFHKGVTNSTVTQSIIRNTGDDGLAMWSDSNGNTIADSKNIFSFNRVEMPVLANGIALYGGTDNSITDNYIADQQAEGGGIHVGNRFSPVTPVSGTITIARNMLVRTGSMDYYNHWNYGTGAIWFYALDQAMTATINVDDNQFIDNNYEAIHFTGSSVTNVTFNNDEIKGAGTYAIEIRSKGSATFNNVTATGLGASGIFSCQGTAFKLVQGAGNSGWDTPAACGPYPTPKYAP